MEEWNDGIMSRRRKKTGESGQENRKSVVMGYIVGYRAVGHCPGSFLLYQYSNTPPLHYSSAVLLQYSIRFRGDSGL
jgi:hypothetical protein